MRFSLIVRATFWIVPQTIREAAVVFHDINALEQAFFALETQHRLRGLNVLTRMVGQRADCSQAPLTVRFCSRR